MSETETPQETPSHLRWTGMTDVGRFRKNNEDAFLALNFDAHEVRYLGKVGDAPLEAGDFVFAVSDGMGGANAGEFASRIAVQKITELLPGSFKLGAMGIRQAYSDLLGELFEKIHREMCSMSFHYEECRGMGATLSLCWFSPHWLHFCHVGDSRIYYLPAAGGIQQLTIDHTHVASLLRKGRISKHEARYHPARNVLDQALGGVTRNIDPQVGSVGYEVGDRFIICSDGLTNGVFDHRLEELLRKPPPRFEDLNPAERLIKEGNEGSGRDNLTAIVIEVAQG